MVIQTRLWIIIIIRLKDLGSGFMGDSPIYGEIMGLIDQVIMFDTHEQLLQERTRIASEVDVFSVFFPHHASSDLVSAGMPQEALGEIRNPRLLLKERWEKSMPFWKRIQNIGYARAVNLAAKGLYGVDGISDDSYLVLTERMKKANVEGLYKWVLREKSRIDISILDTLDVRVEEVDAGLFVPKSNPHLELQMRMFNKYAYS